ncbi:MAG: hypothetical protein HY580_00870 [Nitrospinae bacterium]|nr:hypothetical protein [Nitrospinota bacterium]
MPEKPPPILEINLDEYGGTHPFSTLDDFERGINNEERRWSWIQKVGTLGVDTAEIWKRQTGILDEVRGLIQQARQSKDDAEKQTHLDLIKEKLETHYKTRKGLNSNAPQAKLFFTDKWELRLEDREVAFFALAYFLDHVLPSYLASPKCVKGMLEAISLGHGMTWTEFKKPVDDLLIDARKEISTLEDTYDKKLALQAPVKYWGERNKHHKSMSKAFTCFAGAWGVLGFVGLGFLAWKGLGTNKPLPEMPFLHLFLVVAATSIFVWAGRVLVRLLLSHKHLEIDAQERRVMILTYLAMLKEGRAPTDDDRKLILASIFRPSVTGIVKDDAMPFNLEMMQKLIASGK